MIFKTKYLFNAFRSEILMEINVYIPMDDPKPLRQRLKGKNKDKCYAFHKDHGHDREYYWDLNRVLNDLGKKGKLDCYLKNHP